jgi:hypothetical protein
VPVDGNLVCDQNRWTFSFGGNRVSDDTTNFGRTIQLFLVDGMPTGLIIASIHGWTGSVLVASQSTFGRLLARPEVRRTGVYILYGPDPKDALGMRAYIGEADSVRDRIDQSAKERGFWETAIVITTSDEALTKGHVRYLEARLIDITRTAGRVTLDNNQEPSAERRRLPEADRANMEAFLANLKVILPVVGLDLLKPRPKIVADAPTPVDPTPGTAQFEIRHKSGVHALAVEQDGEFVVLAGSQALKDAGYAQNTYAELKAELVAKTVLAATKSNDTYEFKQAYAFKSPSAAAAIVLDRNSNGRTEWKLKDSKLTYHEWQEEKAKEMGSRVDEALVPDLNSTPS